MLTNSLKILDTTKKDIFELKFSHSDRNVRQNYCHADLRSDKDPLTC